ncbi:MAG TPA: O-antigen ligase family protein [Vicinamibacteria bacterium]|nr:O-antigen ligase family protein [Vicinamibacteria bacterium]
MIGSAAYSSRSVLLRARLLRLLDAGLEGILLATVAGSALAFGAVHPWAYQAIFWTCLALGLLLGLRGALLHSLRQRLGRGAFCLHPTRRFVEPKEEGAVGWPFDLGRPAIPRPPLLFPGLAFALWVGVQLLPLGPGGQPLTVSPRDTWRGLGFLGSALTLHMTAAVVFGKRQARDRFRKALAGLAVVLALVGLAQMASGETRIYGFFEPWEKGAGFFGPFVNRNHFAGYMLLVAPLCLSALASAYGRYSHRVGTRPNVRRRLVAFETPEGTRLLYACVPALFAIGALVATTSRGGIVAFVMGLLLAAVGLKRRRGVPAWVLGLTFAGMTVLWFGLERLEVRFASASGDAPGRTAVWQDSLARMHGLWLTGSGFNTFAQEMSRVPAWTLPRGATPWPDDLRPLLESGARIGSRAPAGLAGLGWYREAHNDYVQVLVESGLPGLLIAIAGAVAVLAAARKDPWLLAALAGVLLHELVDFDLQIPAVATLFVVLAAWTGHR